jgi:hypothetical protein|tara:strand:- start:134 stop:457 length:324 start_codon:yes stop_codon:yes gene_type:complete
MSNIEYNGWTNWETWNCKLWFDNDVSVYYKVQDICKLGLENQKSVYDVGENVHDFVLDLYEDRDAEKLWGFFTDVIYQGMRVVNWTEIAQRIMEDLEEEEREGDNDE